MAEPIYATAKELQDALGVTEEMLPDAEAISLLEAAEDLVDDRLGNRPIDEDTGRRVVPSDEDTWRARKLAQATLEVAKVLFSDPGVETRQRARSVSGDVSTSGPYGSPYGERFESLLSASGLAWPFARAGRRGSRGRQTLEAFREERG